MSKLKKILLIIFVFIIIGLLTVMAASKKDNHVVLKDSVISLHDHNGQNCHREYKDPQDCRHPCDHTFCECQKECASACEVNQEICNDCRGACYRGNAECVNKCCEDGKIDC